MLGKPLAWDDVQWIHARGLHRRPQQTHIPRMLQHLPIRTTSPNSDNISTFRCAVDAHCQHTHTHRCSPPQPPHTCTQLQSLGAGWYVTAPLYNSVQLQQHVVKSLVINAQEQFPQHRCKAGGGCGEQGCCGGWQLRGKVLQHHTAAKQALVYLQLPVGTWCSPDVCGIVMWYDINPCRYCLSVECKVTCFNVASTATPALQPQHCNIPALRT